MKYIRTKNGIYDTSKGIYTPSIKMWAIGIATIYDEDILKQADTIEELCDRFVAETCDNTKFWVESTLENAKIYCGIKNIYGAIWTDKGLIFVAIMNEDGVLCLI